MLEVLAAIVLLLLIGSGLLVQALRAQQRQEINTILDMVTVFDLERQQLLERIQRPERVPPGVQPQHIPVREDPEAAVRRASYASVGTVHPMLPEEN